MSGYTIKKIDEGCPHWWEQTNALHISNYMWMNNGYEPCVKAWLGGGDTALHVRFEVEEANPKAVYTKMHDPVYKDSCVELFFQPDAKNDSRYINFEMNSLGTLLLGMGADRHNRERVNANIDIFAIKSCNKPGGWSVEYSVPYSWINTAFPTFEPRSGHILRANLYKCGDETALVHYGSWNPVNSDTPDFHRPQDFGEMIFENDN